VFDSVKGLAGKVLVCHCKPWVCHGDVLIEIIGELYERDWNVRTSTFTKDN
jgi:hypothetical protein